MFILFALLLGVVSGLRAILSPAAVSWAAKLGMLAVAGTPMAFMGFKYTPVVLTILAIGELVNDKLPNTPSRKVPPQLIARLLSGALVGATVGATFGSIAVGLIAGALGAIAGTYGGALLRGRLAKGFGKDLPAALTEDAIAILLSVVLVTRL